MADVLAPAPSRSAGRLVWLAIGLGLALRAAAAVAVEEIAARKGAICLFPDAVIYWQLGKAIRDGAPFAVDQWGVWHHALRTPGYPLFLAACRAVFGAGTLPVRLVQAALGAICAGMVAKLVGRIEPGRGVPATAAVLAAVDPWAVGIAAVILSEAAFLPLMVASLWGLSAIWPGAGRPAARRPAVAFATGLATAAAVLVKPSWALFLPAALGAWIATAKGQRKEAARGAMVVGLGMVVAMAPWWVRNARIYGRFVPTALWLGASLHDGLHPGATGASDMEFLNVPEVRTLDEVTQDAVLRRRALRFARAHPGTVLRLAAVKTARYWSPWPNDASFRSRWVDVAAAAWTLPTFALMLLGAWDRRNDTRALVILAGPLLYFAAIHAVFVSSVRYRIPGAVPAMGLAAIGVKKFGRLIIKNMGDTEKFNKIKV